MAYTRTWNESVPLGTAARNTVDDLFRNLKVDWRERLVPLVFTDMSLDPVVLNPAILGNVTGKILNLHWSDFTDIGSDNFSGAVGGAYVQDTAIASEMFCPLPLAPGAVITEAIFYANPNGGNPMTFNVRRTERATGAVSDVFSDVPSFPGYNGFTTGAVTHTIDDDYIYFLIARTDNGNRLYGATVKYDVADCRITT